MFQLLRRIVAFFRRDRLDDELAKEIRPHLELQRRALIDGGLPPADAEREARRQFGNVTAIRERTRDHRGSVAFAALFQDARFGARMLARSPGLSAVVVLTIAFGAGLNGAVFLQFNDAFLRPPDLPNPETLVWLDDGGPRTGGTTYPDYVDYRDRVAGVELAVFAGSGNNKPITTMAASAEARPVDIALASGNYGSIRSRRSGTSNRSYRKLRAKRRADSRLRTSFLLAYHGRCDSRLSWPATMLSSSPVSA